MVVGLGIGLVVFELLASVVLLYRYRMTYVGTGTFQEEVSPLSSVNLLAKVARLAGVMEPVRQKTEFALESDPTPFYVEDPRLGYAARPGQYRHSYLRRDATNEPWRRFRVQTTINADGSRWTGRKPVAAARNLWVFGDSFVFGSGVNDEQSFSFLVQQARPDLDVHLYALGGYSLTQSYLNALALRERIDPDDWIVLGYADFYDERNVQSPSHVKRTAQWRARWGQAMVERNLPKPRASLGDGQALNIDYVQENCAHNDGYCEQPDPDAVEQTRVSAALINAIAAMTPARVFVLHFEGEADNPLFDLLDPRVERVSARPEDFDYFIRDDVEGFDAHPGPYWHYAISRRLLAALPDGQ